MFLFFHVKTKKSLFIIDFESALYFDNLCFSALNLPKVRRLPFDPLKHQTIHLERLMRSKGLIDPQFDEANRLPYVDNIPRDLDGKETTLLGEHNYSLSPTLAWSSPTPTTDAVESEIDYRIHYSCRMLYLLKKVIIFFILLVFFFETFILQLFFE